MKFLALKVCDVATIDKTGRKWLLCTQWGTVLLCATYCGSDWRWVGSSLYYLWSCRKFSNKIRKKPGFVKPGMSVWVNLAETGLFLTASSSAQMMILFKKYYLWACLCLMDQIGPDSSKTPLPSRAPQMASYDRAKSPRAAIFGRIFFLLRWISPKASPFIRNF